MMLEHGYDRFCVQVNNCSSANGSETVISHTPCEALRLLDLFSHGSNLAFVEKADSGSIIPLLSEERYCDDLKAQ